MGGPSREIPQENFFVGLLLVGNLGLVIVECENKFGVLNVVV